MSTPTQSNEQISEQEKIPSTEAGLKRKKKLIAFVLLFDLIVILPVILYFILVPREELSSLENGFVTVKLDANKKAVYELTGKKPKGWVSLKEINYTAAHAVVVSEDWAFYQHNGYDLGQIKEAAGEAVTGERTRGASTISQQVIKNVFLTPKKTLGRKFTELVYSVTMERNVSKEKILETYLNIAEFGEGIYGIKAAAKHYFKKSPKNLSAKEGAFLAMLLPSPKKHAQSYKQKEMTSFAEKTVDSILSKMVRAKYIKKEQLPALKKQDFTWEEEETEKMKSGTELSKKTASMKKNKKRKKARSKKKKKKMNADGYQGDESLELEENPEFDEDAIGEDVSGLEEEFNVE
jgi:monofunctional biosynthetic peptidoglycan transglycosylase